MTAIVAEHVRKRYGLLDAVSDQFFGYCLLVNAAILALRVLVAVLGPDKT